MTPNIPNSEDKKNMDVLVIKIPNEIITKEVTIKNNFFTIDKTPTDDDICIVKMKAGDNEVSDEDFMDDKLDNLNDACDVDIYLCDDPHLQSTFFNTQVEAPIITIEKIEDGKKEVSAECQTGIEIEDEKEKVSAECQTDIKIEDGKEKVSAGCQTDPDDDKKSPEKHIEVSYKCDECGIVYKNMRLFISHKQRHLKRRAYPCNVCHLAFEKQATLKYHTIVKHGDIRDLMSEAQKNKLADAEMKRSERDKKLKLECEECLLRFWKQADLTAHMEKIHSGQFEKRTTTGHTCRKCKLTFKSQFNFLNHLDKHGFDLKFGCKELQCKECKLWFYKIIDLMIHIQKDHSHSKEKVFICPKDKKLFMNEKIYKTHMEEHKATIYHKCPQCDNKFLKKTDLSKHLENHANFRCDFCSQSFTTNVGLKIHERIHRVVEETYKCTQCEEEFIFKCDLKKHMKTHAKEKPYKCTVCDETFQGYSVLAAHSRFHIGEKRYKCSKCDKKFETFKELNAHERSHIKEESFECTECNVKFFRKTAFLKHAKEHPQLKYECSECNTKYINLGSYEQHMRSHQKRRKFNCNECGKKFIHATDYLTHLKTHTKKIKEEPENDEDDFVEEGVKDDEE